MDRAQKKKLVDDLQGALSDTVCLVITHQSGLTVAEVTGLRRQMRDAGASFKVTKNRLARLALQGTKFEHLSPMFTGPTAIAFSRDPVAAAKVAVEFASKNDKLTIVDDVFLAVGSANLDHRGFYYDGEIHCFTIADGLRVSARNPAAMLRRQLWAEFLDLPADLVAPLLADPLASGTLFDRSPFAGNRFVPVDARPPHPFLAFSSSDGAIVDVLQALGFAIQAANSADIFKFMVDSSSRTDPLPET